ncbi:hypothetical protein ACIBI9_09825 [Nonomuraea sp. NPDC050451]|uniref:hypothetical protein n=1 Tax=Nonomuraea sp. NPDC050451 TaxID=3364364 RepID=UPI003799FF2D
MFFIVFGLFVLTTQTLGLLAGGPWDLFGWNLGSWSWLGRLVVIVGWVLLVHLHVRDLLRKRRGVHPAPEGGVDVPDVTGGSSPGR